MPIDHWIQVRFRSKLAAHETANRVIQYVYSFEGTPSLSGDDRVVIWSTLLLSPEPILFLSPAAHNLAQRLGAVLPELARITTEELPEARTLLLGAPEDVPLSWAQRLPSGRHSPVPPLARSTQTTA